MAGLTAITPIASVGNAVTTETQTQCDVSNGNALPRNDGKYIIRFLNIDAVQDATVVIATSFKIDGAVLATQTFTVPHDPTAASAKYIGPFDPSVYNDSGQNVEFAYTYTGTASKFTLTAVHLGSM